MPVGFRNVLTKQSFQGIIAYPSLINYCIEACSMDRMTMLSESIDALDPYSDERDAFATAILGGSIPMPFDSEGRVILTESFIQESDIKDKAIFVGKGVTFEIWSPHHFEEYAQKARQIAKTKRANLHLASRHSTN